MRAIQSNVPAVARVRIHRFQNRPIKVINSAPVGGSGRLFITKNGRLHMENIYKKDIRLIDPTSANLALALFDLWVISKEECDEHSADVHRTIAQTRKSSAAYYLKSSAETLGIKLTASQLKKIEQHR